jgi:hypothetical protein
MRSVVVEFAGLPGAGKTTVADRTHQALVAAGVPSRVSDASISASVPVSTRARRRLALAGAELVRHPVQGADELRAIRRMGPVPARDALAGAVQWFAVKRLEARASRTVGVQLLQEGPVQTLWTLALRARRRHDGLALLMGRRDVPREHLVVLVDAPLDLVSNRLDARTSRHSRTQLLARGDRAVELVAGQELLREILAASDCRQLLLVNDGRESPDELARRVVSWVLRADS